MDASRVCIEEKNTLQSSVATIYDQLIYILLTQLITYEQQRVFHSMSLSYTYISK